jgi:hypothetical protein
VRLNALERRLVDGGHDGAGRLEQRVDQFLLGDVRPPLDRSHRQQRGHIAEHLVGHLDRRAVVAPVMADLVQGGAAEERAHVGVVEQRTPGPPLGVAREQQQRVADLQQEHHAGVVHRPVEQ